MKYLAYTVGGLILLVGIVWSYINISWWWRNVYTMPDTYAAESIHGQVVDAETKQPLEGAIVIALWELERAYNWENPIPTGHMQVTEVLTDAEGRYTIPAWGPKERPEGAYMNNNDPLLVFFKDGYDYRSERNDPPSMDDDRHEEMHNSKWDGRIVELKKFEGTLADYQDRLWRATMGLDTLLNPYFGAGKCSWMMIPNFTLMLDKYNKKLLVENIPNSLIPGLKHLNWENKCGDTEEFIRKYKR